MRNAVAFHLLMFFDGQLDARAVAGRTGKLAMIRIERK